MNPALLAAPALVSADHISIEASLAQGTGDVTIVLDGSQAEAATFALDLDTGSLTLTEGRWVRGDGVLTFSHAELDLGDLSGVLLEARFTGAQFTADGASITLLDADRLRGEDVVLTVCGCAVPTWDVTARRVMVELDDVARFTGGWIRVCERPLIPVPLGMVPLSSRRSGFLLPALGYSQDGLIATAPLFVTLGPSADLTASPQWRQERGLRGLAEARYALLPGQGGSLDAALGYDTTTQSTRWAGSWRHGWQPGLLRTAVDARVQSDSAYLSDYGASFLARATPFMESRALLEAGPLQLQTDRFQHTGSTLQQALGAAAVGTLTSGPVSITPRARMDVFATGSDPWALSSPTVRTSAGLRLATGRQWSALRLSLHGAGTGVQWSDQSPWAWGEAGAQARVPLWGDLGRWRHLAEVGVAASAGGTAGEALLRAPDERLPATWSLGPVATSRWLSGGGVPISGSASIPWTGSGWDPLAVLRAQSGPWSGRAQVQVEQQHLEAAWSAEGGTGSAVLSRGTDILQLGGHGALRWRSLTAGWRHLQDLVGAEVLTTGPTLRYVSPCDCLDVTASAAWSADRQAPDLGLQIRIE